MPVASHCNDLRHVGCKPQDVERAECQDDRVQAVHGRSLSLLTGFDLGAAGHPPGSIFDRNGVGEQTENA